MDGGVIIPEKLLTNIFIKKNRASIILSLYLTHDTFKGYIFYKFYFNYTYISAYIEILIHENNKRKHNVLF
jgi:hypothetical protein